MAHAAAGLAAAVGGGFDLAIRVGRLPESRLVARKLARGHRVICAAPAYWARHPKPLTPADLAAHECLLWNTDGRNEATWTFGTEAVRVSGRRSSNDGELVRTWALAGLGVVRKSWWDVAADLAAGRLEPALASFVEPADLYAVFPGGRDLPQRLRCLVDHLAVGLRTA
ncbi:substrate binding domain-containing protein [Vulgatibacter sp.]|uniref:substrate binding domain-containing protein n=1 Tax=Vulgatibacter sp. TaxID=1971226 RepID=UPI003564B93C